MRGFLILLIYLLIHNYYLCCLFETFSKKLVPNVFVVIQTVIHTYIFKFYKYAITVFIKFNTYNLISCLLKFGL